MSMARSVPATTNLPSLNSMSPADASSACEAICLPCSTTLAAASTMACAGVHHRARAAGAAAGDQLVAVALQEADLLERHAELLAQHLRERRGVALAVVERAGADGDAAVGVERDAAHLLVGRRGDFEIAADADAAQLAALLALALALVEALPVGGLERLLQDRREVAAVIGGAGGGLARDLALADLVLAAKLDAVEAASRRRRSRSAAPCSSCPRGGRRRDRG